MCVAASKGQVAENRDTPSLVGHSSLTDFVMDKQFAASGRRSYCGQSASHTNKINCEVGDYKT